MNFIKTSLALALASCALSAQAAHFQIAGPSVISGYTYAEASTNVFGTVSTDGMVDDLSADQALLGFGVLSDSATDGTSVISYDWVRELTLDAQSDPGAVAFTIGGTSVLGFDGIDGLTGVVEVSTIKLDTTLRIVSDGEAEGSAIRMLFSGSAESLFSTGLPDLLPNSSFSLTASWGDQSVSWLGDGSAEAFELSLDTVVGADIAFSLSYITNPRRIGSAIDLPFGVSTGFEDSGLMSGTLTLAPVPEPETYALLLAGLGLIGMAARRRG